MRGDGDNTYACLYYDYFLLTAVKGSEVKGHLETAKGLPIRFYILNQAQLYGFKHAACYNSDSWGWQVSTYSDSYDIDFVVPQSGQYALLFACPRWYCYEPVSISANVYTSNVQTLPVMYTSSGIYTSQNVQTVLITQPMPDQSNPNNNYTVVAAIIGGITLIAGLMIYKVKHIAR